MFRQRCVHQGCNVRPSYGVEGTKKAEFCSQHAREDMVDVISKRCGHQRLQKKSSYGV